jgi:hypothetical protein
MANTKYGKHLIPAPFELAREGTGAYILNFAAAKYGVDASWVLLPVIKISTKESLPTHSHDFFQFISWFGADPKDIEKFEAEEFTCLGEEQERHIVNTPTIQILPPGTCHCPGGWLRIDKPVYHFDVFFAPEYAKNDAIIPDTADKQKPGHKYDKNLVKAPIGIAQKGPRIKTLRFNAAEYGIDAGWVFVPVIEPFLMRETPHKHDFHQFLCFVGSDPYDIRKFDAEIEIFLGEEGEKHVITSPTVLHIPPGLVHCPINYKRVGKPVTHLDVYFAPEYTFTEVPR